MKYISTRNKNYKCTSAEAIRDGLANDGGLFVPETIPTLTKADFDKLVEMSYEERAAFVLSKYLEEYSYDELLEYTKNAYARFYISYIRFWKSLYPKSIKDKFQKFSFYQKVIFLIETFFIIPNKSVNCRRINSTSFSLQNFTIHV